MSVEQKLEKTGEGQGIGVESVSLQFMRLGYRKCTAREGVVC